MSQLREQLVEDYADRFARVNASLDVQAMTAKGFRMHDRTFGEVLRAAPHPARVLDLGCGAGFLLNWLRRQPDVMPVGVDASPSQLELARRAFPEIEIHSADGLEYLRANPDSFDGIFCTDVLEHISGTALCIEWVQAARMALPPGGFFVCRSPNAANLTAGFCRYIDLTHERSFTEMSMLQLLDAGGLKDARIVPIRAGNWTGSVRQWIDYHLHRVVFRICGQSSAREFTYNVCAVGYRDYAPSTQNQS
jgi:2-polyprenyl-3-methyl-5-hydroxy-6-metoxy-1,4-benzoquinol methylase